MGEHRDITALTRWDWGGVAAERYLQLAADARFPSAARALARNMLAAARDDEALDGIFKDAGRYMAAMLGIYLHVSGGLTLPRLKALCVASGFLSPGRARDLLQLQQHLGFVAMLSPASGGRPAGYAPTAILMAAWRAHLAAALEAARIVEPAVGLVLDRLDRPEVFETFTRLHSEGLMRSAPDADHASAYVRVIMHRHAGNQIVWALLTDGTEEENFPPRASLPISIAGAARRFAVSRIHIERMLDEAEREGLMRWDRNGGVVLEDAARSYLRLSYAGQLVQLLIAAAGTLRERPELAGRA